jgi:hypothetical protein
VLFSGSSAETDATLRAMKAVATADGARPLSDTDRTVLDAAHTVVFSGHGLLDPDALRRVGRDGRAAARSGRRRRRRVPRLVPPERLRYP